MCKLFFFFSISLAHVTVQLPSECQFLRSVLLESAMPYKFGFPSLIKLLVEPQPLLINDQTIPETVL